MSKKLVVQKPNQSGSLFPIPGCQFLPNRLIIDEDTEFENWERIGEFLIALERGAMWWIGDWLRFGEGKYGETYAQASVITGYAVQTLKNAAFVADQVESYRRRYDLPWAMYADVASLQPKEQDVLLSQAEKEGWKRKDLRIQAALLREKRLARSRDSFFDDDLAIALIEWQALRLAVAEFVERHPRFLLYGEDFIGDVDEEFEDASKNPLEYLLSKHARGARSWLGLQKATGYTAETIHSLVTQLVEQKKLKIVPRGGKTEEARGAVEDVIAAYDDPVGLDYRYTGRAPDDDLDEG